MAKAPSQADTIPFARDSAGKLVVSVKRSAEEAGLVDGVSVLRQSKLTCVDGEWQVQGTLSRAELGLVRGGGQKGVMFFGETALSLSPRLPKWQLRLRKSSSQVR